MNNSPKDLFEFLLWDNCSNNCKFCWGKFLNKSDKFLNHEQKIQSIESVKKFLDSDEYIAGSHVLLVGGEIFDSINPDFNNSLLSLFDFVIEHMLNNKIDLLYVNTNLIYNDTTTLVQFLQKIQDNNLFERLKFTTSYDIYGRFDNIDKCMLMLNNLDMIVNKFPSIHIVANIILTKQACELINNKKFSIKVFEDEHKIQVNTIPYIVLDEEMMADKEEIFKALLTIDNEKPGYLSSYVANFDLPQKKKLYEYRAGQYNCLCFCSSQDAACGHSENFKRYCKEQDRCFVCDIKQLLMMVQE